MWNDLRIFLRGVFRRPGHAVTAVCVLALGLAASTAVFTCVDGLSQSIPGIEDAGALVQIYSAEEDFLSFPDYLDYAAERGAFVDLAAAQHAFPGSLRVGESTHHIIGQKVTGNYFAVLGAVVALGRGLAPDDDQPGAPPVVVLSHRCWQQRFGAEEEILGRVAYLSGNPFTIVGVAAPEFLGSLSSIRPDVWVPVAQWRWINVGWGRVIEDRDYPYFLAYGRLRPGRTLEQARAEVQAVAARLEAEYPRLDTDRRVDVAPASWVRPGARRALLPVIHALWATTALLLLLACANVASLLVATTRGRRQATAIRAALGASPGRVFRQLLVENLLLALMAGGLGLLLAKPVGEWIIAHMVPATAQAYETPPVLALNLGVFGFALLISLVAGLLAGWLPALGASRVSLTAVLKDADRPPRGPGKVRLPGGHHLMVSLQVALSVVLLAVAGLMVRTLDQARRVDPGFATDQLLTATVSIYAKEDRAEGIRFFQDLVDRLADQPWVRSASLTPNRPLTGWEYTSRLRIEGYDQQVDVYRTAVTPGYFETLDLPILRGRPLSRSDTAERPGVVVVNEAFVRRYLGDTPPLHRRLWLEGQDDRGFEIVGVVTDSRFLDMLTPPEPLFYCSVHQLGYSKRSSLLLRIESDPARTLPTLLRALHGVDPDLAVIDAFPYSEVVRGSLSQAYLGAEVFSVVGLLGLALVLTGVFGVIHLTVGRRTREIGIRLAVGARHHEIFTMVLGQAAGTVGLGLVIGVAGAYAASRLVEHLLYGIESTDLLSFAAAAGLLTVTSLAAASGPAFRATRVDPLQSLRSE